MKTFPADVPHILLVDDNRDGLLVRGSLLRELGYQVETARTGEEGLRILNSSSFDVVVTDYRMPNMTGVELIERIRAGNPTVRIILLSGFVEPLGLNEENTGADAVILKSSNEAAQLTRWVKRLLNRPASRKPPASQKRKSTAGARAASR